MIFSPPGGTIHASLFDNSDIANVDVLDTKTNTWSAADPLPIPRYRRHEPQNNNLKLTNSYKCANSTMLESLPPAWWLKLEARKEFWWPEAATITALTILMTLFSLTSPQRNGRSVIFTRKGCERIFSRNENIVFQTLEAKLNTPRMRMKMVDVSEVPTVIGGYYNSLLDTIEEFDGKSWVLRNFFLQKW